MKKKTKIIDGDRVTLTNENSDFSDDLPDNIDFSLLKEIDNPVKSMILLDDDVAKFFRTPKQVNDYLRNQIKQFQNAII